MINKKFIIKKESFLYEAYVWNHSLTIIENIKIQYIDKNFNLLGKYYSKTFYYNIYPLYRNLTNKNSILIWNWYYIYYINNLFFYNLINNNNKNNFEKYNILVINLKSKQLRISINSSKNTIFNLSVGRVLSTLNIDIKSKKKSNKGERLFIEYITNFLNNNKNFFGLKKLCIIKIIGLKKNFTINEGIFKLLNKNFFILNLINELKLPNNYFKYKKIRSIKRRLKKRIIKDENFL
uniref:Ymf61 n=1 Tax=Tetrahymena pigmentosa TaxID=5907 RepID=Q09F13_TETPI|nr:Ymf61 [Tetrahymena pigmentosa]ABI51738.1 Ymf61 [Tetrahymena pigmentosa]